MIDKQISHYKILQKLGAGGMGEVYLAQDTKLNRRVALKFLPPALTADEEAKKRFYHEAQAAAALNHPNIVTIHEIGEHEGHIFIAMEYVEGKTLKEMISGVGARRDAPSFGTVPLPIKDIIAITTQIARGLVIAHEKGIIHRDIKPANIFVTHDNVAKIVDFGLAKLVGGRTRLTKTGLTVGTVAYMSPEQAMGKEVDRRTDIWSLGVLLYEMLAGDAPFRGEYEQALVYSILNEKPEPLTKARPDTPSGLEQIVGLALAKDPANRYQTIEEFLADLQAVAEGLRPLKAKPKPARIFGIKRIYLYAGLAVVSVLFGFNVGGIRDRVFGLLGGGPARAIKLAVLPFANLSGDLEQEYLSDGMTQEMIAQLGRLHPQSLSVIARTSVMRYKKSDKPIDQIGRELGVNYVLEGSVQREAGRIRISAELIQVRDQTQLWGDTYEREMSGILALQSEVAQKVAGALALKLLPSEQVRLANVRAVNPEAYEAYLKGLQHWYKLTPADIDASQQYFELALKKDPNYALAYVGISLVWVYRSQMGQTPPSEAEPKMEAAALKAVSLDDNLAEAHYALALVKTWQQWDFTGTEPEWKRAIELNPSFPDARAYYSHFLNIMKRPEEAMAQIERAIELDPFNSLFRTLYAADLLFVRRYDDAIAQATNAQRTSPDDPAAHYILEITFHLKGMYKKALAEWKAYTRTLYGGLDIEEAFDRGYTQGDYPGAMRSAAEALAARLPKTYVSPFDIASLYSCAGEKDRAVEWLEKSLEVRDPNMPIIGVLPIFDSLHPDPRFQDILRRMKLPVNGKK